MLIKSLAKNKIQNITFQLVNEIWSRLRRTAKQEVHENTLRFKLHHDREYVKVINAVSNTTNLSYISDKIFKIRLY